MVKDRVTSKNKIQNGTSVSLGSAATLGSLAALPDTQNPYKKYGDDDKDSIDDGIHMGSEPSENGEKDEFIAPDIPSDSEVLRQFYDYMEVMSPLSEPEERAMADTTIEEKWKLICNQQARSPIFSIVHYIENLKKHTGTTSRRRFSLGRKPKQGIHSIAFLVRKLKADLRMSPSSFVRDFIKNSNDGVYLLISLLNEIQNDQASASTTKRRLDDFNRTLSDEYDCLLSLKFALNSEEGMSRLLMIDKAVDSILQVSNSPGAKNRTVSLQILSSVCQFPGGQSLVLDALERQRVKFGERVRFKLLILQLNNPKENNIHFMVACVEFLNVFLTSMLEINSKIYYQHELTLCGFDPNLLERHTLGEGYIFSDLQAELDKWKKNFFDASAADDRIRVMESRITMLRDEVDRLQGSVKNTEKKFNSSEKEKIKLKDKVNEYHERAAELQDVVEKLQRSREKSPEKEEGPAEVDIDEVLKPLALPPDKYATVTSISGLSVASSENLDESVPAPPPPPPSFLSRTVRRKVLTQVDLPLLNWTPMTTIRDTLFEEVDDDELLRSVDFSDFEKEFKLSSISPDSSTSAKRQRIFSKATSSDKVSFVDVNRAKNMIITQRKIGLSARGIRDAIDSCSIKELPGEYAELLLKFIPSKDDMKLLAIHSSEYQKMGEAEQFLFQLSRVERLETKLSILAFIDVFDDLVNNVNPQIDCVLKASSSVLNCTGLTRIFELILAFGNYMNSGKRGYALGFRLDSLYKLTDVKSANKQRTLLHFIVQQLQERNPELLNFHTQLKIDVEKGVSYKAILSDVIDLRKGLELVKYEKERQPNNKELEEFFYRASTSVANVVEDFKKMEDSFNSTCTLFGENYRDTEPDEIFKMLADFVTNVKEAQKQNLKSGTVVRNKASLFGNRNLFTQSEHNPDLLSKAPPRSRPQIPFKRTTQLLPDKQKIQISPRKNITAKADSSFVTNVKVEYPSPSGNPVSVPANAQNIVRLKISGETGTNSRDIKLDSDVVLHRSPSWKSSKKQAPEPPKETDERDENAKSVYNDVIRALKKTRSPMYAELDQTEKSDRNQSTHGANDNTTTSNVDLQRKLSNSKGKRPDRVSEGNTPADVRLALAALNTVIDDVEKGEASDMAAEKEFSHL